MIDAVLASLIRANLAAGAAVLVVLAIRKLARPRFGARAAYALWLAPLAAGLAALPSHAVKPSLITPVMQTAAFTADEFVAAAAPVTSRPDLASLAVAVWLAGMAAAVLLVAWRQGRFLRAMGRLEPGAEPGVFRAQNDGIGPAVVGTLRARIVTPADFETRFAPAERALILAHERAHLAGGDAAANALACAVQCLCWFNPLVHLAARLARIDQELACDAAVVGRFPDARRAYGELLLKTQLFTQALPLGCHWPAPSEHPLKERIAMLKSPPPERAMRIMGVLVAVGLGLGAGGLAWAAQAGPGAAERLAAEADAAQHPSYTCDPDGEARGEGCKIIRTSAWLALPTHDDIIRHYPTAALKAGVTAEVRISCVITAAGLPKACAPVETFMTAPDGVTAGDDVKAAFGKAAVEVSRYYQARLPKLPPQAQAREGHGVLRVVFAPNAVARSPGMPGAIAARPMPLLPAPVPAPPAPVSQAAPVARKLLVASPAPVLVQPDWVTKPNAADIADVYPPEALKTGLAGAATLGCAVSAEGRLTDCKVEREAPAEAGFGAAALKLSERFQMRPMSRDGQSVAGGKVRIPFRFSLPGSVSPSAAASVIRQPAWIQMPTAAQLARFYPPAAAKQNFEGTSRLACAVEKDGRLSGCVAEGVATFGVPTEIREDFRKATLELAGFFRMQPQTVNGAPVAGGRVVIPIRWSLPNNPEAVARFAALKG